MAERITRLRDDQGGRLPNILPVNWVPAPEMPEVGKRVQWWDARFGPEYAEKGLRWIARRKKKDDLEERYEDVVTALATSIRDLVIAPHRLPELTPRPTWDEVTQAFPVAAPAGPVDPPTAQPAARLGTGGPDNVHIVVLAGSREEMSAVRDELDFYGRDSHDWRPFQPVKEGRLSAYALERIAGRGINAFLQPTGRPLGDVLDEAGRANEVVVILLDAWSAGVPRYQEQLELYDERNEVTAVVIAPRSRDDRESMARATEIHQLLRQAMPRSMVRRDPLFKYGSATLPAFRHQLDKAILEAQQRSFQLAEVHRRFPPAGPAQPPRLAGP
jgi:FxsC-like protein